jgi:hypothetical protein
VKFPTLASLSRKKAIENVFRIGKNKNRSSVFVDRASGFDLAENKETSRELKKPL